MLVYIIFAIRFIVMFFWAILLLFWPVIIVTVLIVGYYKFKEVIRKAEECRNAPRYNHCSRSAYGLSRGVYLPHNFDYNTDEFNVLNKICVKDGDNFTDVIEVPYECEDNEEEGKE